MRKMVLFYIAAFILLLVVLLFFKNTSYELTGQKGQLNGDISKLRTWMAVFIILSGILLTYTTISLFRQQSIRKRKEKDLETVLNRISDSVVSVDNNWRYTFLNDAAMATHPRNKEETLGELIWDVHPEIKGTVFWNKYHEAMQTRKAVEIENYYAPMNTWFVAKVYPSNDGLTIFYKDITKSKNAEYALSQSLKELTDYKYALDESSIVGITDQKGIIKYANENFCKISRYTAEELIGKDHGIINSGHHSKEFVKNLWTTIADGKIWRGELKNKAKDGTIYWVDTTIVPFLDDKGKPYQYIAIKADITERKRVEDDLASSEMRFRSLIENNTDGITMVDEFSNLIYRSPASLKIMGEYATVNTISRTHADYTEIIKNKFAEAISKPGIPISFLGKFLHAAGHYFWSEGTLTNLLHVKGVNAIVANYHDVTQRKETEEKLIKSEKIYRTIASSIPGSVICLLDKDYRYLLIEGDMVEKLGYSKNMLLGNKVTDVLRPEIYAAVRDYFKEAFEGNIVSRETSTNGYDIISRFIPLKDENNFVYAIMTVAIDVTKLKKAQRDIAELNRALEEKIIQRTEELKISNEELEAFSYSISHDLRAPLRAINGYANILEEDYNSAIDEEGKRLLGEVQNNAKKMGVLIDDLLAFSKLGRKEIIKSFIDMNQLAQAAIKQINQTTPHHAEIKFDRLIPVMAGYTLLEQVMINLISNAVKYSDKKEKPIVEIRSTQEDGELVFSVSDNGTGFDMKYAHKIFGVFQRLHSAEEFPGTGVGLAIVQRIINKHKGKIWAQGKIDEGATFYFTLPETT